MAKPSSQRPDDAWSQFLDSVRKRCSQAAFGNWLAPVELVEISDSEVVLQVPNIFVQEYLLSNYKEDLCAFFPLRAPQEPAVRFVIAPQAKKGAVQPAVVSTPAPAEPVPRLHLQEDAVLQEVIRLNPQYRFDNFIEGPANQFVKTVAMGVASHPGASFNPLVIHGDVGLGKTHILHAIGHHIAQHHKKLRIQCITTEAFINDLVDHLRNKSVDRMKKFYRSEIDVLLIDDIQFLENRSNFGLELFYTFEALKNKGAQIVITSDKPPSMLKISERTIGKMEGGLVAHMGVPDLETRVAILQYKAEQKGLSIPHKVAFFIAEHIHSNVRQLEGAINRLSAHCRLMDLMITEEMVTKNLREMFQNVPGDNVTVEDILKSVADVFQVRVIDLIGGSRTKEIALPRQVAMYLAKEMINQSLMMLSASFRRTHSTILHACSTIQKKLYEERDRELEGQIRKVRDRIEKSAR